MQSLFCIYDADGGNSIGWDKIHIISTSALVIPVLYRAPNWCANEEMPIQKKIILSEAAGVGICIVLARRSPHVFCLCQFIVVEIKK